MIRAVRWLSLPYSLLLMLRDPQVPVWAKLRVLAILSAVMAYILSPLNVIPEWIPILGWIDDLIILQLAIMLAARVVPESRISEKAREASAGIRGILIGLAVFAFSVLVIIGLSFAAVIYGIYKLVS